MRMLENMPWVWGVLLAVGLFVSFAIGGLLLVRRSVKRKHLQAHHDVAGFVFANLGVLYSVLLGFTVVNVQQRFDKVKEITQLEAGFLAELYRDAEMFSSTDSEAIRSGLRGYAESVINEEWDTLSSGEP